MTPATLIDRVLGHARALVILMTVAATTGAAQATSPTRDATTEVHNETVVAKAFADWIAGGNVFARLLASDVAWTIHGSGPVAGTYRGLKNFVDRAALPLVSRLATPLTPRVHHIWAIGDRVIIRFEASATTTSGTPYNNQFVWIFRMKNGSVVEAEAFLDLVAYQQVIDNNEPRRR